MYRQLLVHFFSLVILVDRSLCTIFVENSIHRCDELDGAPYCRPTLWSTNSLNVIFGRLHHDSNGSKTKIKESNELVDQVSNFIKEYLIPSRNVLSLDISIGDANTLVQKRSVTLDSRNHSSLNRMAKLLYIIRKESWPNRTDMLNGIIATESNDTCTNDQECQQEIDLWESRGAFVFLASLSPPRTNRSEFNSRYRKQFFYDPSVDYLRSFALRVASCICFHVDPRNGLIDLSRAIHQSGGSSGRFFALNGSTIRSIFVKLDQGVLVSGAHKESEFSVENDTYHQNSTSQTPLFENATFSFNWTSHSTNMTSRTTSATTTTSSATSPKTTTLSTSTTSLTSSTYSSEMTSSTPLYTTSSLSSTRVTSLADFRSLIGLSSTKNASSLRVTSSEILTTESPFVANFSVNSYNNSIVNFDLHYENDNSDKNGSSDDEFSTTAAADVQESQESDKVKNSNHSLPGEFFTIPEQEMPGNFGRKTSSAEKNRGGAEVAGPQNLAAGDEDDDDVDVLPAAWSLHFLIGSLVALSVCLIVFLAIVCRDNRRRYKL